MSPTKDFVANVLGYVEAYPMPVNDALTKQECPCCEERHPASQGITVFTRAFECERCAFYWEDVHCSNCDDKCPNCGNTMEPFEVMDEEIVEAAL